MKAATRAATATVIALGIIAAAISYDHIRHLAQTHGEPGWRAHLFPLSIDGLEAIAGMLVLADHHNHRRTGTIPWLILATGLAASVTANVAAAPHDPISRILAAWPAGALSLAIKLTTLLLTRTTPPPATPPAGRTPQLPKTPEAQLAWQRVWDDHHTTGATDTQLAVRHHISDRQARSILAAGRAGLLHTPPEATPAAGANDGGDAS